VTLVNQARDIVSFTLITFIFHQLTKIALIGITPCHRPKTQFE